jgi:hypothetical protein
VLYRPEWHERLTERQWDARWVRASIADIVAGTDAAHDEVTLWPAHADDAVDLPEPLTDLYSGAAGVVWALHALRAAAETALDLPAVAERVLDACRAAPEIPFSLPLPEQKQSSLLLGETGPAFVAWLTGADDAADDLLELVRANVGNEANELMWGVPGTLLVARTVHHATGEERWADAVAGSERALREARDADGLWTQRLYGYVTRYLGPVHGFVGNVLALGEIGNAGDVLRETAVRDGAHVNWPPEPGAELTRLQWCHGAPGIVSHAASYLDEDLLVGGAQLTWDAGPFELSAKGPGLCHGTAGNGYALLTVFARTHDELWLERARAFAVHALEQAQRLAPRYSLFTGGLGAAVFAADCLDGVPRFPLLSPR